MERRKSDEHLGYLTAKVEGLDSKIDTHMDSEEEKIERVEKRIGSLEEKVDKILEKTQTVRGMLLLLKFLGTAILFAVALKFGDIKTAWDIFKGSL